ncbi:hypothetical protein LJC64_04610 [Ruminococcaceae bacterium OttesenSCG-928-A11]|nr:hypothetical protein [Ruminococcaceae bacterium OttesenSCG-928-A11]
MKAEEYIVSLKAMVNKLSVTYGSVSHIETLVYDENEIGLMQRAEIKEISDTIAQLNQQVNDLYEDCGGLLLACNNAR